MRSAHEAGSPAIFIADQIQLVDQAARTFRRYGLPIGITQGDRHGNREQLLVASAQTLAREERRPDWTPKLIIIDEAHIQYREVLEWARSTGAHIIGLSATPLSDGLARWYEAVVNVTTTDELLDQGRLVPMRVFAPPQSQIDHHGVRRSDTGAFDKDEMALRTSKVCGDVVSEWVARKNDIFGAGVRVPTAVFTNTIEDGAAYAREFQRAGYDFRQTTGEAASRAQRADTLRLFEEQKIDGVISCHALAKGWDSSIVMCIIDLQSNGASVTPVVQKYGRGMRTHASIDADGEITHHAVNDGIPRKDRFLLQDHVGNAAGWATEILHLYSRGVSNLKRGVERYRNPRPELEREPATCPACGYLLTTSSRACPACGRERDQRTPRRAASSPERLREFDLVQHGQRIAPDLEQIRSAAVERFRGNLRVLWYATCSFAAQRGWSGDRARWYAAKQYEDLVGERPPRGWRFEPERLACPPDIEAAILAGLQHWARTRNATR